MSTRNGPRKASPYDSERRLLHFGGKHKGKMGFAGLGSNVDGRPCRPSVVELARERFVRTAH